MLFFQPPTPTPPPITLPTLNEWERIINRFNDTVNASQQQGAVGAIQLIAIAAILVMIWLILRTYVGRNKKDNSGVLIEILTSQQNQIEANEKERRESHERMERERRESEERTKKAIAEVESRYIKIETGHNEALKYLGDQIKQQSEVYATFIETMEALGIREEKKDAKITSIQQAIENLRQGFTILNARIETRIDGVTAESVAAYDAAAAELRGVTALLNASLERINKKRIDTQPIPAIDKDQLDSDGKPTPPNA